MHQVSPELLKHLQAVMQRPEGTVALTFHSPDLFNLEHPGGQILQIPAGQHHFLLERDSELLLHFYYSSPGTGTRVAKVDLKTIQASQNLGLMLSWSPAETQLLAGPLDSMQNAVAAKGVPSDRRFRIGADGTVAVIGDHGVSVEGVHYYVNGQAVIEPTALEAWNETVKALELLATGRSSAGHLYEVALANLTLSILATGFEAYTRQRFIELVHEGIAANEEELLKTLSEAQGQTARATGMSVTQYVYESTNFMSYEKCKRAYNKAYGIRFGDLGLPEGRLASLKSFLRFRHKIVHVSPLLICLNPEHCPPENPALPNARMAKEALECFSGFIEALHAATLTLRAGK